MAAELPGGGRPGALAPGAAGEDGGGGALLTPSPPGGALTGVTGARAPILPGRRKAAVLLAAIGAERAANVLSRLGEEEVEHLSLEMARLDAVAAETAQSVFNELAAGAGSAGVSGGVEFAREVIERALGPERAVELLGRLSGGAEPRPFEFLRRLPAARVAALMHGESAQAVALVLANLPAGVGAAVLAALPEQEQPGVALRIARMSEVSGHVIQRVEAVLRERAHDTSEQISASAGGPKALAEILGHADRSVERNVLEQLSESHGELAEEVRGMLFVFEDIVKLEERAIQQVLREVDQKDLVLALRGASPEILELVLANMSERGAAMLKEEMEIQQPQRKRDVDHAQSRVVAVVRRLEEAGTIVIGGQEDEQESESVV